MTLRLALHFWPGFCAPPCPATCRSSRLLPETGSVAMPRGIGSVRPLQETGRKSLKDQSGPAVDRRAARRRSLPREYRRSPSYGGLTAASDPANARGCESERGEPQATQRGAPPVLDTFFGRAGATGHRFRGPAAGVSRGPFGGRFAGGPLGGPRRGFTGWPSEQSANGLLDATFGRDRDRRRQSRGAASKASGSPLRGNRRAGATRRRCEGLLHGEVVRARGGRPPGPSC